MELVLSSINLQTLKDKEDWNR